MNTHPLMMARSAGGVCSVLLSATIAIGFTGGWSGQDGDTHSHIDDQAFAAVFDGVSLDGWEGDVRFWSVEAGEIVGRTTNETPTSHNTFLILKGKPVRDFEMRAEVRMIGDNNSGIQYRATRGEDFRMTGYQCDIHPNTPYNGMLYEEGGRGIIATHGQRVRIDENGTRSDLEQASDPKEFSLDQWHEVTIIARGNRLEHRIDGHLTVVVEDHEDKAASREGIIALQLHTGAPYEVRFRKLRLKRLE